jgi:hypothetical protein
LKQSGTIDKSVDGVFYLTTIKTGKYSLTVEESCDDKSTQSLEQTVWVKYVRRELESLNVWIEKNFWTRIAHSGM